MSRHRTARRLLLPAVLVLSVIVAGPAAAAPPAPSPSAPADAPGAVPDGAALPQVTTTGTPTNGTPTNGTPPDPGPEPQFSLRVTASADRVVEGDPYNVTVVVRNVGDANGTKTVEFEADYRVVAEREVFLEPGETRTLQFTHRFDEPDEETVTVDHSIERTVTVAPARPDVAVTDLRVSDRTVGPSEAFDVVATVTNTGDAAGTERLELVLFEEVVAVRTVNLSVGETRNVSFTRRIESPGTYTASVGERQAQVRVSGSTDATRTTTDAGETRQAAPGFGVIVALLGVLLATLALLRRS